MIALQALHAIAMPLLLAVAIWAIWQAFADAVARR